MTIAKAFLSAVIIVFFAPVLIADDPKDDAKEDAKKLQGTWQVTKFIDHSEEAAPADEIAEMSYEFKGDSVIIRKRKKGEGHEVTYTLNPSKKPKWIDIGVQEGSPLGEGIYKLDGDELTLCMVGSTSSKNPSPRPSEFKAKKDQHSLLVLKRVKK